MHSFIVGKFVPLALPKVSRIKSTVSLLQEIIGRVPSYACRGRWAIRFIVETLKARRMAVPAYICDSVLTGIRSGGAICVPYDIDPLDLNASVSSIERLLKGGYVDAVLVASMYGNPAALGEIEEICAHYSIPMIDDAAQAFGASLNGRWIGTFGDIGLMSFSPGKTTVAHMGAFYWANKNIVFPEKPVLIRNSLYHRLVFHNFLVTRVNVYNHPPSLFDFWISRFLGRFERLLSVQNDSLLPFENLYLQRVIIAENEYRRCFRCSRLDEFISSIRQHGFRIVRSIRGEPNPHKIVIVFDEKEERDRVMKKLIEKRIYCQRGYTPISFDSALIPISCDLADRILEIPLEFEPKRFSYLIKAFRKIVG